MRNGLKWTAIAAGLLVLFPGIVAAQEGTIFLELGDLLREGVPPNCSSWHELYPNFCVDHHQVEYEDGGDGMISECDWIQLEDGTWYHVDWVGPTYWLDCEIIAEPAGDGNPENPVCEEWVEIWPNHGTVRHVVDWQDNGDGIVSPCDIIIFGDGLACHIQDIGTNIRIRPYDTPTEDSSWSHIKSLFGSVF